MLLPLIMMALSVGTAIVLLLVGRATARTAPSRKADSSGQGLPAHTGLLPRPDHWLAVKSRKPAAIQAALRLHNPRPCSWREGLLDEQRFFIAPPRQGWIVVIGSGLPDPAVDVDACFRFVVGLSRKLGQVQFFSASRILHHHAWVRVEGGRVVRAYAWAGETLWSQGPPTPAEKELGLKCFDYAESPDGAPWVSSELVGANADKVPLLAARWSLDPAQIDEGFLAQEQGIAGEPS